jgi:hypothetical protein
MNAYPQPKKKDLVKCGYKYIDALMRVHNLKGDKVKRVLHNVKSFEGVLNFNNACSIFGEKFILNQPDDFIQLLLEKPQPVFHNNIGKGLLTKKEFSNFFEIYKLFQKKLINNNVIDDHFRFYRLLDQMEPVKWTSRTHDEFVQEHYDWSEKYNHYTNGNFTRIYNQEFVNKVNEVILTKDGPYYPEVLTTSKRYNNESSFQSNCVKTYGDRVDSIIISLRKDNEHIGERATIQFLLNKKQSGEVYAERLQTLGRFNKNLTSDWDPAVQMLEQKFKSYINKDNYKIYNLIYKVGFNEYYSEIEFQQNKDWYYLEFINKEVFGGIGDPLLMPMEIVHINEPEF